MVIQQGTNRADKLTGTSSSDFLIGLGGNDTLYGNDGKDELFGGRGNDLLDGGTDIDTANYSTSQTLVKVNLGITSCLLQVEPSTVKILALIALLTSLVLMRQIRE